MAKILQRLGAFRNKAITHSVDSDNGPQEFKFYPPRMRMLLSGRMREILEPLSQAASTIFSDTSQDVSRQQEVETDGRVTTFVQGINPDVIALRAEKRAQAIKDALAALLDDNTRWQLGELLADSLRDDFPEDAGQRAVESKAFMDEIDLPTLGQFIQGYFKALKPILDKSGNSIFSSLQETVTREVKKALGATQAGDENLDDLDESNVIPMEKTETPT